MRLGQPGAVVVAQVVETQLVADLVRPGERVQLARGGNGGWGNLRFKSSTNRAPANANPGQEGVERTLWLRLKLIADAGLVGLPNAGKSTFLAATTNATPKIADYPFTTLHPGLGVVGIDGAEFVLADIPGLIEGASEGRGLGDQFLGHIERCAVLLHLVDATSGTILRDYRTIVAELAAYGGGLAEKPRLVALSLLIVLSAGASALLATGRQEDPTVTNIFATVTTIYPDTEPARVESLVKAKIEDALRGVAKVDVLQSLSATGNSIVQVELREPLEEGRIEQVWYELRSVLSDVEADLSTGTGVHELDADGVNAFGTIVAITATHNGVPMTLAAR